MPFRLAPPRTQDVGILNNVSEVATFLRMQRVLECSWNAISSASPEGNDATHLRNCYTRAINRSACPILVRMAKSGRVEQVEAILL